MQHVEFPDDLALDAVRVFLLKGRFLPHTVDGDEHGAEIRVDPYFFT